MKLAGRMAAVAILLFAGFAAVAAEPPAEDFAPRFFRGGKGGRPITASIEGTPGALDASLFACSGCHGRSGEGRREGGTLAADIRFGRLREAGYDAGAFCRAVREGEGPGGPKLARAMPRYAVEEAECAALWEHLRRLEQELPPGVDAGEIHIGVELGEPTPSRLAWREALRGELEAANERGGIYGRKLSLVEGGKAALRVLVDGELPVGSTAGELMISVPSPRGTATANEIWQVETPREEQLRQIAGDAASWRMIAGAGEDAKGAAELFSDAAMDAGIAIEKSAGCAAGERRPLLALMADQESLGRLRALDACAERILLLAPALPLEAFDQLKSPLFLVVPFDPGPERDLHAGAHALGRAIVAAFTAAGRGLRQPRLAEELSRVFAEASGNEHALFGGVLLLPRGEKEEPRWLGPRSSLPSRE